MATTAIFPGSFDPVTRGHLDLIRRAASLYDEVVVAVGHNPTKVGFFPVQQRMELLREATSDMFGVRVTSFTSLLVDAAKAEGATVVVRGVRGSADVEGEMRYAIANREMTGIETVFLPTAAGLLHISSSLVREIEGAGGSAAHLVPDGVARALLARRRA